MTRHSVNWRITWCRPLTWIGILVLFAASCADNTDSTKDAVCMPDSDLTIKPSSQLSDTPVTISIAASSNDETDEARVAYAIYSTSTTTKPTLITGNQRWTTYHSPFTLETGGNTVVIARFECDDVASFRDYAVYSLPLKTEQIGLSPPPGFYRDAITVSIEASDAASAAWVSLSIANADGSNQRVQATNSPATLDWSFPIPNDGQLYTITVTATDHLGFATNITGGTYGSSPFIPWVTNVSPPNGDIDRYAVINLSFDRDIDIAAIAPNSEMQANFNFVWTNNRQLQLYAKREAAFGSQITLEDLGLVGLDGRAVHDQYQLMPMLFQRCNCLSHNAQFQFPAQFTTVAIADAPQKLSFYTSVQLAHSADLYLHTAQGGFAAKYENLTLTDTGSSNGDYYYELQLPSYTPLAGQIYTAEIEVSEDNEHASSQKHSVSFAVAATGYAEGFTYTTSPSGYPIFNHPVSATNVLGNWQSPNWLGNTNPYVPNFASQLPTTNSTGLVIDLSGEVISFAIPTSTAQILSFPEIVSSGSKTWPDHNLATIAVQDWNRILVAVYTAPSTKIVSFKGDIIFDGSATFDAALFVNQQYNRVVLQMPSEFENFDATTAKVNLQMSSFQTDGTLFSWNYTWNFVKGNTALKGFNKIVDPNINVSSAVGVTSISGELQVIGGSESDSVTAVVIGTTTSETLTFSWNNSEFWRLSSSHSSTLAPGTYSGQAYLRDSVGALVDSIDLTIAILPQLEFANGVTFVATKGVTDVVSLTVQNSLPATIDTGVIFQVVVANPQGALSFNTVWPGNITSIPVHVADLAAGNYKLYVYWAHFNTIDFGTSAISSQQLDLHIEE